MNAIATGASLVGLGSVITATLTNIAIEVNQVTNVLNVGGELYGPINFAASFPGSPAGFAVPTGSGTTPDVYLDYSDDILLASVSQAQITVSQFINVIGSLAFEQGPADQQMQTADGNTVYVDSMTIGVSGAYARRLRRPLLGGHQRHGHGAVQLQRGRPGDCEREPGDRVLQPGSPECPARHQRGRRGLVLFRPEADRGAAPPSSASAS